VPQCAPFRHSAEARLAKDQPISLTFEEALGQFKKLHIPTMRPGTQKACTWLLDTNFSHIKKRPITSRMPGEGVVRGVRLRPFIDFQKTCAASNRDMPRQTFEHPYVDDRPHHHRRSAMTRIRKSG
jgi:hypothetical protein